MSAKRSPVTGFDHVGIQVRDVERSTRFYEEHLGFESIDRVSMNQPYVQRVVGYHPDVTLEIAVLRIPRTDAFLEILEYRGVDGEVIDPATANPGTAHFSVFVDDLDALHAELVEKGVEFVSVPQEPTVGTNKGGRVVYMKDPDGIRVELVESRQRADGSEFG